MLYVLSLNTICSCHLTPVVGKLFYHSPITFSIAVEGPLHLKPLEQNLRMCSCSGTGNMQLLYNSPGGYLVHVLFSQFVFFPIYRLGWTFRKSQYPDRPHKSHIGQSLYKMVKTYVIQISVCMN